MEKVGLYEEEEEKREVGSHRSYAGVDKMLLGATLALLERTSGVDKMLLGATLALLERTDV